MMMFFLQSPFCCSVVIDSTEALPLSLFIPMATLIYLQNVFNRHCHFSVYITVYSIITVTSTIIVSPFQSQKILTPLSCNPWFSLSPSP